MQEPRSGVPKRIFLRRNSTDAAMVCRVTYANANSIYALPTFFNWIKRHPAIKLLFATGPSINTRLLVAIIASVALLITEHQSHRLDALRATLSVIVDPLKYLVDLPTVLIEQTADSVSSYSTLKKKTPNYAKNNSSTKPDCLNSTLWKKKIFVCEPYWKTPLNSANNC
jgi:hypothetical protein